MKLKIDRGLNIYNMHFGPNLDIIVWIGSEFSRGQVQNGVYLDLKLNSTMNVNMNRPQNNKDLNPCVLHL